MTANGRKPTVGAFGMLTWDQLLHVDEFPTPGGYQVVRDNQEQSGGTTGNMAVALARLGIDVSLSSRVGDDEVGQKLIEELEREGCNVELVLVTEDTPTDRGLIMVSGKGTTVERTILWLQGARLSHGDHLPIEKFFAKDLVIVDVDDPRLRLLLLDLPMHVSPRTRIFGTMTFLTEAEPHQAFELALRHDYLCGTIAELMYATEETSAEGAIERFQREMVLSQVRFALITDGSRGCYVVERESVEQIPAFEVDSVDPTGAGDAFAAGAAYGIIHRWEPLTTAKFANVMGALATRRAGARAALPSLTEVYSYLQTAQSGSSNAGTPSTD